MSRAVLCPLLALPISALVAVQEESGADAAPGLQGTPAHLIAAGVAIAALLGLAWVYRRRLAVEAEALLSRERGHRFLLEHASDAIVLLDSDGASFLQVNAKAAELFGRTSEELLRAAPSELLPGVGPGFVAAVRAGRQELQELSALRPDGTTVPVEASASALHDGRVQAILRDLTARRRQEEERRTLERHITETQRLESLGLLAGGVAHDFNNLMMIVAGSADRSLRQLPPDSPPAVGLSRILSATQRATELTQQLLAYAGRGTTRAEELDLNELIGSMGSLLRTSIARGVQIEYDLVPDPPPIEADPGQLQQVVLNLVVNASESIDGDGRITIRTRVVRTESGSSEEGWLDPPRSGRWLALVVGDDGHGMDAPVVARMFEPFFSTRFSGRGLGLAAVRGIVRTHAGNLRVRSRPGEGSELTVLLPAAGERGARAQPAEEPAAVERSGRVLVVDDEETVREVTRDMLFTLGLNVVEARSGKEALEIVRRDDQRLELVLLDLTMPGMDGASTLDAIAALATGVPVVLMSGYAEPEIHRLVERAAGFLRKPFNLDELEDALDRAHAPAERPEGARTP
ncbi:MAG: response regulator [Planctomycetota bacterium]